MFTDSNNTVIAINMPDYRKPIVLVIFVSHVDEILKIDYFSKEKNSLILDCLLGICDRIYWGRFIITNQVAYLFLLVFNGPHRISINIWTRRRTEFVLGDVHHCPAMHYRIPVHPNLSEIMMIGLDLSREPSLPFSFRYYDLVFWYRLQ